MNQSELLIDYINGDLPIEQESKLFTNLSINNDLRDEFRVYQNLKKTAKSSINAFVPDINLTNSVFASLGITSNLNQPINNSANHSKLLHNSKMMTIGGIIVFLILSPLYFLFNQNQEKNVAENSVPVIIKTESKKSTVNNNQSINQKSKPIIKYVYMEKSREFSSIAEEKSNHIIENSELKNNMNKDISEIRLFNDGMNLLNNKDISLNKNNEDVIKINELSNLGLSFEMKSTANWNNDKETIYPSYMSKINNMDLAILYEVFDGFYLGADFRHETFFVKYYGINEFNQNVEYEQNPNLYSYGLMARFKLGEIYNFNPFIQGMFSANNYGLILRSGIGLEYRLLPQMGITFLGEYSNLNFQHQNNNFNAGKFSLNYGIKYSL